MRTLTLSLLFAAMTQQSAAQGVTGFETTVYGSAGSSMCFYALRDDATVVGFQRPSNATTASSTSVLGSFWGNQQPAGTVTFYRVEATLDGHQAAAHYVMLSNGDIYARWNSQTGGGGEPQPGPFMGNSPVYIGSFFNGPAPSPVADYRLETWSGGTEYTVLHIALLANGDVWYRPATMSDQSGPGVFQTTAPWLVGNLGGQPVSTSRTTLGGVKAKYR